MLSQLTRARVFGRMALSLLASLMSLALSACGTLERFDAVPVDAEQVAAIPNMRDIRFWGDGDPAELVRMAAANQAALEREMAHLAGIGHKGALPPVNALAISGGGESGTFGISGNGAFGAGVLVGWTAAGTRPVFKIVTGISTGALTAPFAFLGSAYDDKLREIYTTISGKDVLDSRGIYGALFQDALADNAPLRKTVAKYFDQAMLDAIGEEDKRGRSLFMGTTNLDAMRPVIWSIGAIANSGQPSRLQRVQDILVASAAIPVTFPPTMFDVRADGKAIRRCTSTAVLRRRCSSTRRGLTSVPATRRPASPESATSM
jgi:Patatin-like phospholipase